MISPLTPVEAWWDMWPVMIALVAYYLIDQPRRGVWP